MKQLIVLFALIAFAGRVSAEETSAVDGAACVPEVQGSSAGAVVPQTEDGHSAEREALVALNRSQQLTWQAAVVERLVERGGANDLAIASLLAQVDSVREFSICHSGKECTTERVFKDSETSLYRLLAQTALERADEIDTILLYGLISPRFHRLEPEERDALADLLIEFTPNRLSSWSTKLDALQKQSADPKEITALINQASQSLSDYRDPAYETTRQIDAALALVPMPAELKASTLAVDRLNDCGLGCLGDEDEPTLRMIHALGYGMAVPLPSYLSLTGVCDPIDPHIDSRRAACLRIARSLAMNGENGVDVMIGGTIWHRLVEGTPQQAEAIAAKRRYYWQSEHGIQMQMAAFGDAWDIHKPDPEAIRRFAAAIRDDGSSEISVWRDYMRKAGFALDPPASWMPMNPDVLKARR